MCGHLLTLNQRWCQSVDGKENFDLAPKLESILRKLVVVVLLLCRIFGPRLSVNTPRVPDAIFWFAKQKQAARALAAALGRAARR